MPYEFSYTEGDRHPSGSVRSILADLTVRPLDVTEQMLEIGSYVVRDGEAVIDGQVVMLRPSCQQVRFDGGREDYYYEALPLPDSYFGTDEFDGECNDVECVEAEGACQLDEDDDDELIAWDFATGGILDPTVSVIGDGTREFLREWSAKLLGRPVSWIVSDPFPVTPVAPRPIDKAQAALHAAGYSEWDTPRILNTLATADPDLFG